MTRSATFDEPPATSQDYWVVKAILLTAGLDTNPSNGVHISPTKPADYHYETKGPGIIAGNAVCIFVMAAITLLRLYLRWFNPSLKWGWDDALMIPGLILAVAYPTLQICMVIYGGAGQHIYDITYHEYYLYHWLAAIAQIDFFVAVGIVKMSIAVFNIRLAGLSAGRWWKIGNWLFFTIVLCYIIIAFFLNIFQCVPAIDSFDYVAIGKRGVAPKCLGIELMGTVLRAINITLDYCLLSVPLLVIWQLKLSTMKKLRIAALFAFGALACIGSVMTLVAKSHLKTDALWNYTSLLAWTLVEITFSVITASLPTLAFLLPKSSSSTIGGTNPEMAYPPNSRTLTHRSDSLSSEITTDQRLPTPSEGGIMRHNEIEMSTSAAGEFYDENHPATPYESKEADYRLKQWKSEDTFPGRYGPLEKQQR